MSIFFSTFNVTRQVFLTTNLSFGVVNLKPLIPGHVLICPQRIVPRLQDLQPEEITDLFLTVQRVGKVLERVYEAEGMTVSCQDGKSAGQSVPHVHVHLIPRKATDFGGNNDLIYPALETHERGLSGLLDAAAGGRVSVGLKSRITGLVVPKDEDRVPRSDQEMHAEAEWLASFFTPSSDGSVDGVSQARVSVGPK